ncbi:MAG: tetratricopeptide repeat protein [Armatimonadota bacterium]
MKRVITLILVVVLCAGSAYSAKTKPGELVKTVEPVKATQEGMLSLAEKYTRLCEPKLQDQDRTAVAEVRKTVADNKFSDIFLKKALDDLISHLTLELASAKSLDGLTVSTAFLVNEFPQNRRVLNLFGSVLHTYDKYKDAIVLFQYLLSLDSKNVLIRLNLANVYLDDNQDEKAKAILDKLEFEDSDNKAVFRALATYYYKKNNAARFREYLFKAATFKGFKRKKVEKQQEQVDKDEVKQEESTGAMEAKLKQLQETVPLTTADILEPDYPNAAQKIRDKYGKLAEKEKWILPKLPQTNLNGPEEFRKNKPIVEEWVKVASDRLSVFAKRQAAAAGIDIKASKKVQQKQAQAAADKSVAEAIQQAQQAIKYMESMPGIPKEKIAKAKAKMAKLTQKENIKLEDKPVDLSAPPPVGDSGSLFAYENYSNYLKISVSYEKYFQKYHKELQAKFADIMKVYEQKVKMENERWDAESENLSKMHADAVEAGDSSFHQPDDAPCREARISHLERLNSIADSSYRQWSNIFMPQYAQKMKPNLDAYFNVCMLHIRNMRDPRIMEQEYNKVTMTYAMYSNMSISYIGMGGGFKYYPGTEEKRRQLEQDIAKAKEEAESKKEEFKREFKSPEFSFTDWVDDHFVLDVSSQFLALRITSHSIEFKAYVPGIGGGVKYDFTDEKFQSYTATGMKLDVGVSICGVGGKVQAGGEAWRRTATWDLKNGTYHETDTAKAEAKATFGPLSAAGEFQLDTQLNAKVTSKMSLLGTATTQYDTTLN